MARGGRAAKAVAAEAPAPPPPAAAGGPGVEWPADKPERRMVADLEPHARNARKHSPEQIEQIAGLILRFGWTMPVLVDEAGTIIAGHGRVLAAQKLGYAEVPVLVARGWSETQKRAYMLADNRVAELSTWDASMLSAELTALADDGLTAAMLGFEGRPSGGGPRKTTAIEDSPINATFWIAVEGPLPRQAEALAAIKALAALDGVKVTSSLRET
jgi:hypothetical protein